jgi:hypothetical protein
VGKPQEKRPLERPKRRWKDNTKIDLKNRMVVGGLDGDNPSWCNTVR